ncbi:MAG: FlgO family outer membrane protein [Chthoniobacterales bacterium]
MAQPVRIYEFGEFRLDAGKRLLRRRDGTAVPLTPRVFETLLYMVQHHDAVLDKERLMEAVWPDSIVEENNLTQNISTLRRIFGEEPGSHRFIVTVPGRGYRFVADVRTADKARAPEEIANGVPLKQRPDKPAPVVSIATSPARRNSRPLIFAAAVAIVLGAGAFFVWQTRTQKPAPYLTGGSTEEKAIPEKSIAVLPFTNLSDDQQNAYFADGVQDEILTDLAKVADLKVISRMSVAQYKNTVPRNLREIAQQLGVAHLLEGSVQRAGNRIRINVQLIDAGNDRHLWAQTYDRDVADVFAIQSEIAQSIAANLQARISAREKAAMSQARTTDLVADRLYAQARNLRPAGNDPNGKRNMLEAVRLLEEAVARDPHFLLAYCLLAETHLEIYWEGFDHTSARRELANAAIQSASHIQPEAGEVHWALAAYAYHGFRDYDRARAELEFARNALPNDVEVYDLAALIDRRQARWTEAMRNLDRAIELDPLNFGLLSDAATTAGFLRLYPEANGLLERALKISPRDYAMRTQLALNAIHGRADTLPLHALLSNILNEEPRAAERIAYGLFYCAWAERDSAAMARALAAIPAEGMQDDTTFLAPREWYAGLAARTFGDLSAAQTSFTAGRVAADKMLREQPDYAAAWSVLGLIDAGLARKDDAVREGRRACELLPVSRDAIIGPVLITDLAVIYAWTGEKNLALEQLAISAQIPSGVTYGDLKLNPRWDSLRGDPRFEKIVASLAPNATRAR